MSTCLKFSPTAGEKVFHVNVTKRHTCAVYKDSSLYAFHAYQESKTYYEPGALCGPTMFVCLFVVNIVFWGELQVHVLPFLTA